MTQTVGDFVVSRLQAWGVRRMFGYPGDGINGVFGVCNAPTARSNSFRPAMRKRQRSWHPPMSSSAASWVFTSPRPVRALHIWLPACTKHVLITNRYSQSSASRHAGPLAVIATAFHV